MRGSDSSATRATRLSDATSTTFWAINYRMTNLAAAILCAQLERLEELTTHRREVLDWYESRLKGVAGIRLQSVVTDVVRSPWLMTVCVDDWSGAQRDHGDLALGRRRIETRPSFVPMQGMPYVNEPESDQYAHRREDRS